jgi:hypothetical protein
MAVQSPATPTMCAHVAQGGGGGGGGGYQAPTATVAITSLGGELTPVTSTVLVWA